MAFPVPSGASYGRPSDIITQVASVNGLPAWIPLDIARYESSLNPQAVGDNGTSFGLFQLHRGGLAPRSLSDAQLMDPYTNASIAIPAMLPAYRRGVAAGLTGETLLDYVATSSGWPGNLGPSWTQRNRPDYIAGLHNVYVAYQGEQSIPSSGQVGGRMPGTLQDMYAEQASTSGAVKVFRAINSKEQLQDYKSWRSAQGVISLNPFAYWFDQGQAVLVRTLIVLLALAISIIALIRLIGPVPGTGGDNSGL